MGVVKLNREAISLEGFGRRYGVHVCLLQCNQVSERTLLPFCSLSGCKQRTIAATTIIVSAITNSPPLKLPVRVRNCPNISGPAEPPRVPTELMRAIAPAAAVSPKNAVENAQNGPSELETPVCARDSVNTLSGNGA